MKAAEIRKLREGFAGLMSYPYDDKRGFLFWAGKHGYPDYWCPHHSADFLTWHRSFLLAFELALQDVLGDYDFGLPYWDWTADDVVQSNALPDVLEAKTYSVGGNRAPNPLRRSKVVFPPDVNRWTARGLGVQPWLAAAAGAARGALAKPSFAQMQDELESGHDGFHGWVGGDMGQVPWAAFDPIFWFHHCNIDRLWAKWQDAHPTATYPSSVLNSSLRGFAQQGQDVIDYRALDYEYGASHASAEVAKTIDALLAAGQPLRQRLSLQQSFDSAELVLSAVKHPRDTLQIRVFLDASSGAQTSVEDAPTYAGARFLFGHGDCTGKDGGHCDWKKPRPDFDPRGAHHLKPYDVKINISDTLRAVMGKKKSIDVTLVLVDSQGDPVPPDRLRFDRLSLTTRD